MLNLGTRNVKIIQPITQATNPAIKLYGKADILPVIKHPKVVLSETKIIVSGNPNRIIHSNVNMLLNPSFAPGIQKDGTRFSIIYITSAKAIKSPKNEIFLTVNLFFIFKKIRTTTKM